MDLSIIIPCKNEQGNIEELLDRIPSITPLQEIIFIDGHSNDLTFNTIEKFKEQRPEKNIKLFKQPGKGKSDAVFFGCNLSLGKIIIILDADLTIPPESLTTCYNLLIKNPYLFVNGNRLNTPLSSNVMPHINQFGNCLAALYFSWFIGSRFHDTLCGLKGFHKSAFNTFSNNFPLMQKIDPFGDFDLLFAAKASHLSFTQLPITYSARTYGTSKINRIIDTAKLVKLITIMSFKKTCPHH